MAFSNLFANLSALCEDVKTSGPPACTDRENTAKERRGRARKRKVEEEHLGSYNKKQRCQVQSTTTYNIKDDNIKAVRGPGGYTREERNNRSDKAAPSIRNHKGQNYKSRNNCEVNKQQHQEKKKWQKNQHTCLDKGRQANGGGRAMLGKGGRRHQDARQDFETKPPRFMTQEFKDQNALEVDGRLLCRHFLWGRCNKADSCQLEHVQGYNGLIKAVCKFYVQGMCTSGERCPYMHESFPCKFFHTKGNCSHGAYCRFSHEPLNDTTNRLLEEILKRDSDLYELAKKAEEKSSGQLPNTAESEITEANETPSTLTQELQLNFYNSTDAAKETLLSLTEEQPDPTDKALLPHASDAAQPQSPPSTNNKEPVCYSVEAFLGPQLSRPFPSFFTAPGSQESTSLSVPQTSSDVTLGSTNQSEAPYAVNAVLRSFKSVEDSTFDQRPTTTTVKTVFYTPQTDYEESSKPLLSSKHEKISLNTRDEANKSQQKMFKGLPSLQLRTGRISKTCPGLSLTSEDHDSQYGDVQESIKTAQRTSHDVKLELSCFPVTQVEKSVSSKGKGGLKEGQTCPPTQPRLSGLTSDSQSSIKLFSPSAGFSQLKGRAAVEPLPCFDKKSDTSDSPSHHFATKQRTECGLILGTRQHYWPKASPECNSEKTDHSGFSKTCKKTQKIPFYSLFANPISDSVTPAHPRGVIQAPRCADSTSKDLKTAAEPDKPSSTSFLSLFAAPLIDGAASSPCLQSQADYARTPRCRQKSVDDKFHLFKSPPPCEARADATQTPHRPPSSSFSSTPKNESVNQPVNPVCEIPTSPAPQGLNPSVASAQQQLPDISSPRDSVLKSLFLCLSPYQEDEEQRHSIPINAPPD